MGLLESLLPFTAMILLGFGDTGLIILAKAALSIGMSNFVYVVYYNAIGTLILFPHFLLHIYRNNGVSLTFSLLSKFLLLGLLAICFVQLLAATGIKYSSPTLSSAMSNLIPVFTFLLAVIFRMEKVCLRSRSSQAKIIGAIVSVTGAFIVTLYKGPPLVMNSSHSLTSLQLSLTQKSNWLLGGFLLAITCLSSASLCIIQAAILKEYSDKTTIVFFSSLFGTIQCTVFSLIAERDSSAWTIHHGIEVIAILYSAIVGSVLHSSIIVWCLHKKGPVYVALFKPSGAAISVVMSVVFLGETPYLGRMIGAIVIVLGFYAVMWGQAKQKDTDDFCSSESSNLKVPLLQNV